MNYAEHPSVMATLESCTVKTRHLRDENGIPWGTVVVIEGLDFTVIGASSCHRRDTFSKKKGRFIAEVRAMRGIAVKLGLADPHMSPMTLQLDRTLEEGERPIIETVYGNTGPLVCLSPTSPSRSIVLITEGPSLGEDE